MTTVAAGSPPGPAPRRRRRARVLLTLASAVLTVACLEGAIRVSDAARGRSANARTAWYWTFERDPFTGYRGRPNVEARFGPDGVCRHNAEGFRDERELPAIAATPGRRLIVCVGESSTYGAGAPRGSEAYPARLEVHLRRLSGDANWFVFNAGYPAFTSHQVAELVQLRLLKHRPDAIVMMDLRNDVEFVARRLSATTDYSDLPLPMARLAPTGWNDFFMRSSLVGLVVSKFQGVGRPDGSGADPAPPVTERGRAFYADNLARVALLCRRAGVEFLPVDQPIFDESHHASRRAATASMRETLAATCREAGVRLLDAERPLKSTGWRSPDEVHLGSVGYDKLAEILAPQVLEALARRAPR